MRYRQAGVEDIPAMHEVRLAVRENVLSNPVRVRPENYRNLLERDGRCWLCEADGRVAGFVVADRVRANLWALFVAPEFEGRGIGRQLLDLATAWLLEEGDLDGAWLSTEPGTRAQRLYQRSGWSEAGTLPNGEVRYEITRSRWRRRLGAPARIGLVSDTHGLLRPEAISALRGCDHILHAGDIGGASILRGLQAVAPVTAVRGNNDGGAWARSIPGEAGLRVGRARILVTHDAAPWKDRRPDDIDVLVTGHSHHPRVDHAPGFLRVNPGSAGPRRFSLPVSIGILLVSGARIEARLKTLEVSR